MSKQKLLSYNPLIIRGRKLAPNENPSARLYIAQPVSYINLESTQASELHTADKKSQADNFFREQAKKLDKLWYDFQAKELFPATTISAEQIQPDLDRFYKACMTVLGSQTRALNLYVKPEVFSTVGPYSDEQIIHAFMKLNNKARSTIISKVQGEYFKRYGIHDRLNITLHALTILPETVVDRLKEYTMAKLGDRGLLEAVPMRLSNLAKDRLNKGIETFKQIALKEGFQYLGQGDVGLVFACEAFDRKAVFKIPIYPLESSIGRGQSKQEEEIEKLELLLKNHPSKHFAPELLKDNDGNKLGIPGKVMVMKFIDKEPITSEDIYIKEGQICGSLNNDYKNFGIDNQYAVDFMSFYLLAARNGIELHDIRPGNFFYKAAHFHMVELGGLDDAETRHLIELRKEYPVAFLIYTLMESIFMFGTNSERTILPKEMTMLRDPNLAPNSLTHAKTALKFAGHRFAQMLSCLELAVEQGVMTRKEIIKGIKDLKILYQAEIPFMYPAKREQRVDSCFGFSTPEHAYQRSDYEYLDYMEQHFKQASNLNKLFKNMKGRLRNQYLSWFPRQSKLLNIKDLD